MSLCCSRVEMSLWGNELVIGTHGPRQEGCSAKGPSDFQKWKHSV